MSSAAEQKNILLLRSNCSPDTDEIIKSIREQFLGSGQLKLAEIGGMLNSSFCLEFNNFLL